MTNKNALSLLPLIASLLSGAEALALDWQTGPGGRSAPLSVVSSSKSGFTRLTATETGIVFTNKLSVERGLTNQIYLNGSGVAAGDIDGDGLCDLYFCGIDRPGALYRNLGNWKFADITSQAGVACADQASTGAVFADVDGDGNLDLLVNGIGRGTRLFLNDGKGHFRETTASAGLRGRTGSMSMALADVDGDGWLDLYVVNYRTTTFRDEPDKRYRVATANKRFDLIAVDGRLVTEPDLTGRYSLSPGGEILENGEPDVLYHNDGHGQFTAVSWTDGAFLDEEGRPSRIPFDWGLSAMFRDLNGDGAPDLYVCNDFQSEDRIWLNDQRGHFRAISKLAARHTSLFSMGVDFADLDRDGHDEIFVADMLSRDHARRHVQVAERKMAAGSGGKLDDRPQYSRNTLFWNRGDGTYAEIAQLSGVEASEWSWCPIFLDVDFDGFEDLLVTTGHGRDAQNIDIVREMETQKRAKKMSWREQLELRKQFPKLETPIVAFRNRGDLTFEDIGARWGFDSRQIAQGMCLADLDNDGDMDLVISCLDGSPLIYRNEASRPRIAVRLKGAAPNTQGIGAKIKVLGGAVPMQSQEVISGGRYLSGDDPLRAFAAGTRTNDLTIQVTWRNGHESLMTHAEANRIYELDEAASQIAVPAAIRASRVLFADASGLLDHTHIDFPFDDFQRQPLLPRKFSQLGPGIAWFDLDGDGWEDLIIGSGRGGKLAVFKNDGAGSFAPSREPSLNEPVLQDETTVLGWNPSPGETAILIGSANYEDSSSPAVRQYNAKKKVFAESLPGQTASTGPLALGDVTGSGELDLFVGGRVIAGRYPEPAPSLFYRNEKGTLRLDTEASRGLAKIGLISGAIWSDLDGDGFPELVLACDGGPVHVLRYQNGIFADLTTKLGLEKYLGWWNSVSVGDFDGDGRLDIVAGNWGRNTKYQRHLADSLHLYYGGTTNRGPFELLEAYYDRNQNKIVPWRDLESLSQSFPFLAEQYQTFSAFGAASVKDILGSRLEKMRDQIINTLDSMVFLNRGDHFEAHALPVAAQVSPVFGLAVGDLDGDGKEDIFITQNFFGVPSETSRYDAGRGLLMKGDGKGGFIAVPSQESGLDIEGEGRGAALCDYDHDGRLDLVVSQNGNATKLYRNSGAKPGLRVRLQGSPENPNGIGAVLRLKYSDGKFGPAHEVHAGGGYWSQDSATTVLGLADRPEALSIRWPGGFSTIMSVPEGPGDITAVLRQALKK